MKIQAFSPASLPYKNALLFLCSALASTHAYAQSIQGVNSISGADLQIGAGGAVTMWIKPPTYTPCPQCIGIGTSQPAALLDVYGYISVDGYPLLVPAGDQSNISIGNGSLVANPFDPVSVANAGTNNTAAGELALGLNAGGINNSALGGQGALRDNTTGSNNSAIGTLAISNNITGTGNSAAGGCAGSFDPYCFYSSNATYVPPTSDSTGFGNYNTAIGYGSLSGNNGDWNVAVGVYTGQAKVKSTSSRNTYAGDSALNNIAAGNDNVALGVDTLSRNTTGNNNIALGQESFASPALLYWGSTVPPTMTGSFNIGIGNSVGDMTIRTGSNNVLIGNGADVPHDMNNFLNLDGAIIATCANWQNVSSLINDSTCSGLGPKVGLGLSVITQYAVPPSMAVPQNTLDVNGNGSIGFTNTAAPANGLIVAANVGIGTSVPDQTFALYVNGPVHASSFDSTSDVRLKEDIQPIAYGLDTVMHLRPVGFDWKNQSHDWQQRHQIGLIAQQVEPVVPEVVSTAKDSDHTKSLAYGSLMPVLIKAIQELKTANDRLIIDNEDLQTEMNELDADNASLRQKLYKLKLAGKMDQQ
jgi:hypothetical protein